MIRNLLYNCCPLERSEEWRLNIDRLNIYGEVFNGRKIVLIKTGPELIDPPDVESAFAFGNIEFVHWPNDKELQEVAGFIETLGMLKSLREDEITFYAHTKGVSYGNILTLYAVRNWRNKMYDECLRDPKFVEVILSRFACAGCYQRYESMIPLPPDAVWHYSGTFWWVNHARLFSNPRWDEVFLSRYGTEAYLGRLFRLEDTYCLYSDATTYDLYAATGEFKCRRCEHVFIAKIKPKGPSEKICPTCFKRQGHFIRAIEE